MKTVVIIGASGGIGKTICEEFYANSYNVVAGFFKNEKEIDELCGKSNNKENRICPIQINLEDPSSISAFFKQALSVFGKIDVAINCAGVSHPNLLIDAKTTDIINEINVNLLGTMLACKEEVLAMLKSEGGKIINISSIWGVVGGSCESTYSATKSGIIGFSKALAKEMGNANIAVNCISPGAVKTKMNSHLSESDYEEIKQNSALPILPTAQDIASACLFLANSNSITGQNIVIDAGFTL